MNRENQARQAATAEERERCLGVMEASCGDMRLGAALAAAGVDVGDAERRVAALAAAEELAEKRAVARLREAVAVERGRPLAPRMKQEVSLKSMPEGPDKWRLEWEHDEQLRADYLFSLEDFLAWKEYTHGC